MAILDLLVGLWRALWPFIVLAVLIGVAINVIGRRLDKHDRWFRILELRVGNLHEERERRRVESLQYHAAPPTLSDAKTTEVSEDLLLTLRRDPKARKEGPS